MCCKLVSYGRVRREKSHLFQSARSAGAVRTSAAAETRHAPIKGLVAHPARVLFFLVGDMGGGGGDVDSLNRRRGRGSDVVGRGGGGDGGIGLWAAMLPELAVGGESDSHGLWGRLGEERAG